MSKQFWEALLLAALIVWTAVLAGWSCRLKAAQGELAEDRLAFLRRQGIYQQAVDERNDQQEALIAEQRDLIRLQRQLIRRLK